MTLLTPAHMPGSSTPFTAAPSTPASRSGCSTPASSPASTASDHLRDLSQAVREYPVLVAAGHYMADDTTLDWLVAYAAAGGHLILGPQTGYADHEGRARAERQPARIASAAGVWFDEFSNLSQDLPVTSGSRRGARAATGGRGNQMARWPSAIRCSGTGALSAPPLRPVAGGHVRRPRARPDHLRRHHPQSGVRPGDLRMARPGDQPAGLERPAAQRHRHQRHRPGRPANSFPPQLVLDGHPGRRAVPAGRRAHRRPIRHR